MVSDFLRRDGWMVVNLGADVPTSDLVWMATRVQPVICLLSAARPESLPALGDAIGELHGVLPDVSILVGGVVFRRSPTMPNPEGAAGVAGDAAAAVAEVRRLLGV